MVRRGLRAADLEALLFIIRELHSELGVPTFCGPSGMDNRKGGPFLQHYLEAAPRQPKQANQVVEEGQWLRKRNHRPVFVGRLNR